MTWVVKLDSTNSRLAKYSVDAEQFAAGATDTIDTEQKMRGLPPKLMGLAVALAWIMATLPGISFVAAAGITLTIAWFIYKLFK